MTATLIDGKWYANRIKEEVAERVNQLKTHGKESPGLATVLVGEDPASQSYVRSKHKACEQVGFHSVSHALPACVKQEEVEKLVEQLNTDEKIHGILVQLPLPSHLDEESILSKISIHKDVDGFHPVNLGRLAQKGREPSFVPCTPAGILYLLEHTLPSLEGKQAVVLGRSNIVGMPVALLLVRANATVTICHSRTQNLADVVRSGDIVVAAIGRPEMVKGGWIKHGAVVIDVGINRVDDPSSEKGSKLVGDVDFNEVQEVASAITPVPGGVGPMTIAMLLRNTLKAAENG